MHLNPYIVLGSAVVGLLVGLTGAGGGALMTPMLILLFGIKPSTAISSDLVAAVFMRPVGAAVHMAKRTVNLRMVGWMVCGSVPMAFVGAFLLKELGNTSSAQKNVEIFLGVALLVGAAAMVLRYVLDRRSGRPRIGTIKEVQVRPMPTILIGAIGGLIVGMTSVGSGSLMIVLLLFLYPLLGANQLVGTDLTQAVPLTAAAALGALIFGSVQFGVTGVDHHRQRARRADRLVPVLPGAGPLHQADHHLRDLRLRPEVRRGRHDHAAAGSWSSSRWAAAATGWPGPSRGAATGRWPPRPPALARAVPGLARPAAASRPIPG